MAQQTAVEKIYEQLEVNDPDFWNAAMIRDWFMENKERFLQMEKEQISKAWDDGDYAYFHSKETGRDFDNGEEYYNETYAENKTFKQNKFDPNFMHEWIRNNGMRPTKEKE